MRNEKENKAVIALYHKISMSRGSLGAGIEPALLFSAYSVVRLKKFWRRVCEKRRERDIRPNRTIF